MASHALQNLLIFHSVSASLATFPDIHGKSCDKEIVSVIRLSHAVWAPALVLCHQAAAQCPANLAPHFDCVSAGGNTQITLFADAELSWDRFHVPVGGSLHISSSGGIFSSRHLVTGLNRAGIEGPITADGPFTLISRGLGISPEGGITAPSMILSTLPALDQYAFQGTTSARSFVNNGTLLSATGDLTVVGYQITNKGTMSAPSGRVNLVATGSETVALPDLQRTPGGQPGRPLARATNRGIMEGQFVDIYSEGFFENGGRLAGRQISIEAQGIAHNNTPGSVIETPNLRLKPNVILGGPVINPNDGNNPGGVSTTLGFPDLASGSFAGKKKTLLRPTQYAPSTVNRSRVPSAVSRQAKTSPYTRIASRGTPAKKKSAKKRSFFGMVISK
ncbi:hypothetical protein N9Z79_08885 [Akkermansiaceae bacterium]|nr:hypothetical protein [Akkermansiaceae bacterium]MDB4541955.1 hypothetical protein [bacterium]